MFLILLLLSLIHGNVTYVSDGDTLQINHNQTIRLALVDTPELKHFGWYDAKKYTIDHCLNKGASINIDDKQPTDLHGRSVAIVKCGNDRSTMNQLLLKNDYAVLLRSFCDKSEFTNKSWIKC